MAAETLVDLQRGYYEHEGERVDLASWLEAAVAGTRHLTAGQLAKLPLPSGEPASVEVTCESTTAAVRRHDAAGRSVSALNFASARNPGGGWDRGAMAQEESICRASGLYPCLQPQTAFYKRGRAADLLYTHDMLLSPDVPIFRDDTGVKLPQVVPASIVTAAAPNAAAIRRNTPQLVGLISATLRERVELLARLITHDDAEAVVLGAWGCGVFGNDPVEVARLFRETLPGLAGRHVTFAVYDRPDGPTVSTFREAFADHV